MSAPPRLIRDFTTLVGLCARGRLTERLDAKVAALAEALHAHPDDTATGSITLTLTFARAAERVTIKPKVLIKLPEEKGVGETTLFDVEGGFSLQHPSQLDMFSGPRDATPSPAKRDRDRDAAG